MSNTSIYIPPSRFCEHYSVLAVQKYCALSQTIYFFPRVSLNSRLATGFKINMTSYVKDSLLNSGLLVNSNDFIQSPAECNSLKENPIFSRRKNNFDPRQLHVTYTSVPFVCRTSVEEIKSLRLITAIKTPYLPDGRFDLEAYDALVNMQIEDGVEGVIVGGTTGEGQLMGWDEHIMLIGHTVNCFGGLIKVIGNTGSNSTREAIHATEQGFAVGMHAALHINPYYGKTSLEGLISHFDSVLPMGPTIIYNVPSRTGQDVPPRVIHTLVQSPNMAGVKECVGNDRVEQYTSKDIVVWSGNDDECHDSRWVHGATGVISVTSNLVPSLIRELMFGGKNPSLNSKLQPLIKWLFCEPNPIGLNTALAQLGVVRPVFRLPYVPLPLAKRIEFVNIVKALGREYFIGEKEVQVLEDDDFVLIGRY